MQPVVKAMTRLGFFKVMVISTVFSALMSTFVAWVFGFFIDVPNYAVHIKLAFIIPFFVSPGSAISRPWPCGNRGAPA